MEQELDYAEMLEIPVSTVNVVKKKRLFTRRAPEPVTEDLKEQVVESVNERLGAYVAAEDLTEPEKPKKRRFSINFKKDRGSAILLAEAVAVGAIALGIFLTNVFMPNSAINSFIASFSEEKKDPEPSYNEFVLSPVVSAFSEVEPTLDETGVLRIVGECAIYPVCNGTVQSVTGANGDYTVKIAHSSSFSSVITGLSTVYATLGAKVATGVPIAYSDGGEVTVSMYDGNTLLNCYILSGAVPVWTS